MNSSKISFPSVCLYTVFMAIAVLCLISMAHGYNKFMQNYRDAVSVDFVGKEAPASSFNKLDEMIPRKVKFTYSNPSAKEVYLHADFNLWGLHEIRLEEAPKGKFSKTVVLPQGDYKYYFNVDGVLTPDPGALSHTQYKGQEVCLKTVL